MKIFLATILIDINLFSQDIDIAYVSKRLGHINIQTTQNYYLELMPEKKHQQDADALSLLNDLSL